VTSLAVLGGPLELTLGKLVQLQLVLVSQQSLYVVRDWAFSKSSITGSSIDSLGLSSPCARYNWTAARCKRAFKTAGGTVAEEDKVTTDSATRERFLAFAASVALGAEFSTT
jgi:hypothetical protein